MKLSTQECVNDPVAADPIIEAAEAFAADSAESKVDLGIGTYRDESGATPILGCIREAADILRSEQDTKSYLPFSGNRDFNTRVIDLVFGLNHPAVRASRVASIQTCGGTAALRVAADLAKEMGMAAHGHVPSPTWSNHFSIMHRAGIAVSEYRFFDSSKQSFDFDQTIDGVLKLNSDSLFLVHGCCHNPTGAVIAREQWDTLADSLRRRGCLPVVDLAYQGLGQGLDIDAYGVRLLANECPTVLVAASCSKNFGLYRERVGALIIVADTPTRCRRAQKIAEMISRDMYAMPPDYGAALVNVALAGDVLRAKWMDELSSMRRRIVGVRRAFAEALNDRQAKRDFSFLSAQEGMFSTLDVDQNVMRRLRQEFHVYLPLSGRINVTGINHSNIEKVATAFAAVVS